MTRTPVNNPLRYFLELVGRGIGGDITDGQLLERFVAEGEEAAFTALVRRHGPMVLGVCRRVLRDDHDAEDAFQATFLVLARKAASLDTSRSLGNWLYTVAQNLARKVKAATARRRDRERQSAMSEAAACKHPSWDDVSEVLDDELGQLPEKYRAPLVLCYLQGKTNEEAARELGWPAGSIAKRLARARELLQQRLARRGVALSAALLSSLLTEQASAAVAPALIDGTGKAALSFAAGQAIPGNLVSPHAVTIAEGAIHAMFITKLKLAAGLVLAVLVLASSGLLTYQLLAGAQAQPPGKGADMTFKAGDGPVLAVAFAPDGKSLATIGTDDKVRLWNAATGKETGQLLRFQDQQKPAVEKKVFFEGPPSHPPTLVFAPDGKTITATWDYAAGYRTAHRWDLATGKELGVATKEATFGGITAALTADGKLFATADERRDGVIVGGAPPKAGSKVLLGTAVPDAEIRKGGKLTVHVRCVDGVFMAMRKEMHQLAGHTAPVTAVAFSADGKMLASGSEDQTVRVWDVVSGKELRRLEGLTGGVSAVAFTGPLLAAGTRDGTVRVWDISQPK